jgi:2-polyprenyl-3-methyl-5-hydroxy-6-metoxy-1,4-benzoquinol methylase
MLQYLNDIMNGQDDFSHRSTDQQRELETLERVASDSWYAHGANAHMIKYCAKVFARYLLRGNMLELGPAEGIMTVQLAPLTDHLTLVDGSEQFCSNLRRRFPQARVVHSLFEDFQTEERFDNIVLGHVLEHVIDPVAVLRQTRSWLKPDGRILAAVPNARSLHRQAAVIMGLLPFEEAMNETDIHHGHRRVFNPETFRNAFLQAGLQIEVFGGYWLKPVSNRQLEEGWSPEMLEAFMQLGERYPDVAAEIYLIARIPVGKNL